MHLAIDIGNTAVKYGLFNGSELVKSERNHLDLESILKKEIHENHSIDAIIISSVQEPFDQDDFPFLDGVKVIILGRETKLPFENSYQSPSTLGNDRLALVAGAQSIYPEKNVLVIDIGTCITYDLITDSGVYVGGAISPGIELRFQSMHEGTARLPELRIPIQFPELIGKDTKSCMESGVINGISEELNGTINRYKEEFRDLQVIITGGHHDLFDKALKSGIFANPKLLLLGLHQILRFNLETP